MTEIPENAPRQDLHEVASLALSEGERKIHYNKPCLSGLSIERRINNGSWKVIAKNVRPPFTDTDPVPPKSKVDYRIKADSHEYNLFIMV